MATPLHALLCALVALAVWTTVGLPITKRLLPSSLAGPFAPIAGFALHGPLAVLAFHVVPFNATTVVLVALAAIATSMLVARSVPHIEETFEPHVPDSAWLAAGLLALAIAIAILPKTVGDAIALSAPMFDHSKVAMIDDMARLGLPAGNPFLAQDGGPGRLSYYYLWHFGAAQLTRVLGLRGWDADVGMTFFSAFTSLAAMMALAVKFSGRRSAALWVVALAASASSRVVWITLFGAPTVDAWIAKPGGFGGWLFQSAWVPQHLASATCVLLALWLVDALSRRVNALSMVMLGLVIAAAFESSTWIGGVVFAAICVVAMPVAIVRASPARRSAFVAGLAVAAVVALAVAWPLLSDQLASSAARQSGSPVAVHALPVLGQAFDPATRAVLDKPAFWLVMLPVEFTAIGIAGLVVLIGVLRRRPVARLAPAPLFAIAAAMALLCAWLLASTLADNNDLAWRAMLLAATLLIVFAAIGLSGWWAERRWWPAALATFALLLGVPETVLQVERNVTGALRPDGAAFAREPAMWAAVRGHVAVGERVANNPESLPTLTPWPVNLGWALLANRRSCYATWELTQVYSSVPHDRLKLVDALFARVFAGRGSTEDVEQLATVHDCSVAVVTPRDGAWTNDPFAESTWYALVNATDRWRIYRRHKPASP